MEITLLDSSINLSNYYHQLKLRINGIPKMLAAIIASQEGCRVVEEPCSIQAATETERMLFRKWNSTFYEMLANDESRKGSSEQKMDEAEHYAQCVLSVFGEVCMGIIISSKDLHHLVAYLKYLMEFEKRDLIVKLIPAIKEFLLKVAPYDVVDPDEELMDYYPQQFIRKGDYDNAVDEKRFDRSYQTGYEANIGLFMDMCIWHPWSDYLLVPPNWETAEMNVSSMDELFLDTPFYKTLKAELLKDLEKVRDLCPQAMKVSIIEAGTLNHILSECDGTNCRFGKWSEDCVRRHKILKLFETKTYYSNGSIYNQLVQCKCHSCLGVQMMR